MFNKISTALINLFKNNSKLAVYHNFESSKLDGFPALTLTASANESAYSTTTENRRVYAFMVRLYVERGSGVAAESTCENTMRDLVDTILDAVDKNHSTISNTIDTQAGYTFLFMRASPSAWGYAGRENEMRVAEIKIQLEFDIDTTIIT